VKRLAVKNWTMTFGAKAIFLGLRNALITLSLLVGHAWKENKLVSLFGVYLLLLFRLLTGVETTG
jgi:hypothetical protein